MRARNIKPAFFKNELLGNEDPLLSVLFAGLWCLADREGRLEDRPPRIRAEVMPYREVNVDTLLTRLAGLGFIVRYDSNKGAAIQIVNFSKHQNPHVREPASTISAPGQPGASPVPALLIPDSGSRIPDPPAPIPDPPSPDLTPLPEPAKKRRAKTTGVEVANGTKTGAVWEAYSSAFRLRYGVEATRNATVNGQLAGFVGRVSSEEAPRVAEWYVWSNKRMYVERGHPTSLLLRDAESLRMEWARGRTTTSSEATMADKTEARGNVFRELAGEGDYVQETH